VAGDSGECEYCGYQNAPDAPYCRDCGRSLWKGLHGRSGMRGRSTEQFSQMVGGFKPRRAASKVAGWKVGAGAIAVVVIVVVAFGVLRSQGQLGHSSSSPNGGRTDLCQSTPGPYCLGSQITLPYLEEGRELNVSPCDSIVLTGSGQQLQVGYTASVAMFAALVPSVLYWGSNVSFSANPEGFYNDPSAVAESAWNSGPVAVAGSHWLNSTLPDSYDQWCLTWWDPGSPGVVTFDTDGYLTPPTSNNLIVLPGDR
jgi:hypothetical protein